MASGKTINYYLKVLSSKCYAVMCHRCGDVLSPREFEKHFAEEHGDPARSCIWCDQIAGTREDKVDFIPLNPSVLWAQPEDLLQPPPDPKPPLFIDQNLDLAGQYLLNFLDSRETLAWYHVTVAAVAITSFQKALDEDQGHTRTLEFSCLCDSGKYHDLMFRHHRHLVVVSPAHHFERHVWPKVTAFLAPDADYACKSLKRIASPMELVDLFWSLTGRVSSCERGPWQVGNQHHFHLTKPLPMNLKLQLSLLWDGGLKQFLDAKKFQHADLARVTERPLRFVDGKWRQKVGDFYNLERHVILQVSRALKPTRERGPTEPLHTFHLLEGKKVYFYYSREMESLGREEWLRAQAAGGNAFFDNIEEALWTPSDQATLSRLMSEATQKSGDEPKRAWNP